MSGNPGQLTAYHPRGFRPRRQLIAHKLFHRTGIRDVVGQRSQIIETVSVGNKLIPGHVLGDFLVPPVEIADVRIGFGDHLPVQLQHKPKHPMGARMRRAKIQDQLFTDIVVGHLGGTLGRASQHIPNFQRGGRRAHKLLSSAG